MNGRNKNVSSNQECVLVIDLGTSAIKTLLVTANGMIIARRSRQWPLVKHPDHLGMVEIDKSKAARLLIETVTEVITWSRVDTRRIKAACCLSLRGSTVFLDERGKELYIAPNMDSRGVMTDFMTLLTDEQINQLHHVTGHLPPFLYTPLRYWWFKENAPQITERTRHVLSLHDWAIYLLTGEMVTEPTTASEHLLFDIHRKQWSSEILEMFKMKEDFMPTIKRTGEIGGFLREEIAGRLSLRSIPVVLGGGDTQLGLLACRTMKPSSCGIVAGYTAPVMLVTDKPLLDNHQRTWTTCHALPNQWLIESNMGICGGLIDWFCTSFILPILNMASCNENTSLDETYFLFNQLASKIPVESNHALFKPTNTIMNAKHLIDMPIKSVFTFLSPLIPLEQPSGIHHLAGALLKTIAFSLRANLEQVREIVNVNPPHVGLTGGLTKSKQFTRLFTDTMGKPTMMTREHDGSALGGAALTFTTLRHFETLDEALNQMVPTETILPDLKVTEKVNEHYEIWKDFYQSSSQWEL